jgi:hypothetical protein
LVLPILVKRRRVTHFRSTGASSENCDVYSFHRYQTLRTIISGEAAIRLQLEFLFSHNQADAQILKNMKASVEVRNSVCHSAVIFANAMMHSGTTVDTFLRENLEWLGRATNWGKFSATAGLGVIHRGHLSQVRCPSRVQSNSYTECLMLILL